MRHYFNILISVFSFIVFFTSNTYSIPIGSKKLNLLQNLPQEMKKFRDISGQACRNALLKDPENPSLHACVAYDAMKKEQWNTAVNHWKNAISFSKETPEINYYIGLAWTCVQMKNLPEAMKTIQKALELDPESITLRFWQVALSEWKGQSDQVKKEYMKIIPLTPSDKKPMELFYHAVALLQVDKDDTLHEAEKDLKKFLKAYPDHHKAMILLGQTYIKMKDPEKSLSILEAAEKIDPDFSPLQLLLTQANLMAGKPKRAVIHGMKVLKTEPDNLTAHFLIGTAYLKTGQAEKGIDHLNRIEKGAASFNRARLLVGEAYFSEGEMEQTQTTLQELLKHNPKDPAVKFFLIRFLIANGDTEEAVKQCDTVLNTTPSDYLILFMKGIALLDQDKIEEAKITFKNIVKSNKQFYPAHIQLVRIYAIQGNFGSAIREVDSLIRGWPDNPEGYIMKGDLAHASGEKDTALTAYNKALDIEPESIFILNRILNLQLEDQKFTIAENLADQIIEKKPNFPGGYLAKGIVSMQKGKLEEATNYFQKVLELNKKDFRAHNYLGLVKVETSIKEAISHFEASLKLNPQQQGIYLQLAKLYIKMKDEKSGSKTAERWKETYPNQGEPYELMAMICISKNQNDDAIDYLKKAISLEPQNHSFYLTLGSLYVKLGEQSKNINNYEEALKNIPDHPVILNNLAWHYAEIGRFNDGLALAAKAEKKTPNDWNIKDTIGQIYLQKGEYNKAIDKFNEAIAINDKSPVIYFHIGKTYIAIGDNQKALESMKKARSYASPDYPEIAEIERLIASLEK
jgi:tetratricopeptide (TPR) repeat protein